MHTRQSRGGASKVESAEDTKSLEDVLYYWQYLPTHTGAECT